MDIVEGMGDVAYEVVTENMQTVINAIRKSESSENTKVLTDFADKLKRSKENPSNRFANALQSRHQQRQNSIEH
ncbi:hypothetical protein ACHAWO_003976 [Cyclotella atomus]|uniref:Uncharacterized protein n=1 Tax=Cyclotella atomus TaxID=382360 RepID=A0ABD3PVG4_9STRA